MCVDSKNVVPDVHAVLDKIDLFSTRVRSGAFKGCTGKPLRNIVSIGIGKSGTRRTTDGSLTEMGKGERGQKQGYGGNGKTKRDLLLSSCCCRNFVVRSPVCRAAAQQLLL